MTSNRVEKHHIDGLVMKPQKLQKREQYCHTSYWFDNDHAQSFVLGSQLSFQEIEQNFCHLEKGCGQFVHGQGHNSIYKNIKTCVSILSVLITTNNSILLFHIPISTCILSFIHNVINWKTSFHFWSVTPNMAVHSQKCTKNSYNGYYTCKTNTLLDNIIIMVAEFSTLNCYFSNS